MLAVEGVSILVARGTSRALSYPQSVGVDILRLIYELLSDAAVEARIG